MRIFVRLNFLGSRLTRADVDELVASDGRSTESITQGALTLLRRRVLEFT